MRKLHKFSSLSQPIKNIYKYKIQLYMYTKNTKKKIILIKRKKKYDKYYLK